MAKGDYVLGGARKEPVGLDWAGQPMVNGRGYGGHRAEQEAEERTLAKQRAMTTPERAKRQMKEFWEKLRADPVALAAHKAKIGAKAKARMEEKRKRREKLTK